MVSFSTWCMFLLLHPTFFTESSANSNCLQKIAPAPDRVKKELYTNRCPFKHHQIAVYVLLYFLLVFFLSVLEDLSHIRKLTAESSIPHWYSFQETDKHIIREEQMKQNCILIFHDPPELPPGKSLSSELTAISPWSLCVMYALCSRVICSLWGWPFHISALFSGPLSHIQLSVRFRASPHLIVLVQHHYCHLTKMWW